MRWLGLAIVFAASVSSAAAEGKRDEQVNGDRAALAKGKLWIYNDLEKGYAQARASGKPMLVVYRCIP